MIKIWLLTIGASILLTTCGYFKKSDTEPLLSSIDGEEYYNTIDGEMNTRKASLLILEGKADSVNFEVKIDILDSLETTDSIWRKRYLLTTNQLLSDLYEGNKQHIEQVLFAFLLHYPEELISHLNEDGFVIVDLWMNILGKALDNATQPKDITSLSVANAAIKNCFDCSKEKQELIVNFIKSLERFAKNQ